MTASYRLCSVLKATLRWGPRYQPVLVQPSGLDLEVITKLVEEGKMRPVVDRTFKLEDVRCACCPCVAVALGARALARLDYSRANLTMTRTLTRTLTLLQNLTPTPAPDPDPDDYAAAVTTAQGSAPISGAGPRARQSRAETMTRRASPAWRCDSRRRVNRCS